MKTTQLSKKSIIRILSMSENERRIRQVLSDSTKKTEQQKKK